MSDPTRREFFQLLGAGGALLLLPPGCGSSGAFFSDGERRTLAALANAVLPADDTPGGGALGAVDYLEKLLTAFDAKVAPIFLGGPYSGRAPYPDDHGGATTNFPPAGFTPMALDRVAERAWRLRLYGSKGVDGGGPNDAVLGPVDGLRDTIKNAIRQADAAAAPMRVDALDADALATLFAGLDQDYRDVLLDLVPQAAFGAPEYGGNPGGAGWQLCYFEGDQMPLGYSLYDTSAGMYRERPEAPVTTPNPDPDPQPLDDDTRAYLTQLVTLLGGKEFP
ncbi:MAG TPA: hypothetical protein VN947_05020 [Polyangia bacterium]|nr:hypothetical protein [Polyangia bacterium]